MYLCEKLARGPRSGGLVKFGRSSQLVLPPLEPKDNRNIHYFASPKNYVADCDGIDKDRPVGKLYHSKYSM